MVLATNQQKYAVVIAFNFKCCEAYIDTQTIVKCAAYETPIDRFQSLSFFWRTLKNNVQFALMFVCCKVQFEKK